MAQLMRYYQYPTVGIGVHSFTIYVNDVPQTASTRGGDGSGGPYNWALMMLDPDYTITADQHQAIGALCYDAGVAVKMQYAASGSGAFLTDCRTALANTFGFSNAIDGDNNGQTIPISDFYNMVNPNLDAGYPAILGIINDANQGHAVLADGYGYSATTAYHHLNMGWAGYQDAWYNLPTVDSAPATFTVIQDCCYNIYATGTGEIISGRVTDASGNPLPGLTVTAVRKKGGTYTAATNSSGIYALAKIPANSSYTISVTGGGYTFTSQTISTGVSISGQPVSGNYWGADFQAQSAPPPASPASPNPIDSQVAVPVSTTLSWSGAASGVTFDVYLDTVNPPIQKVATAQSAGTFTPAVSLQEATTYYWRVIAINSGGQAPGRSGHFVLMSRATSTMTATPTWATSRLLSQPGPARRPRPAATGTLPPT